MQGKDGVDHINIYSKGETLLGRWMTNFAGCVIELEGREFHSIEGYWYWLGTAADPKDKSELQDLYGFAAKKKGKELQDIYGRDTVPDFEERICAAIRKKVESEPVKAEMLKRSTLPFRHYYKYGDKVVDAGYKWQVELWETIRKELRHPVRTTPKFCPPACHEGTKIRSGARKDKSMTKKFTTGRVADKKRWEKAGWLAIDVTVKSSKRNARLLAPTWKMVKAYMAGTMSEEEYCEDYASILTRCKKEHPELWNNTVERHDRVVFLCYCKPGEFCHRRLLAASFMSWAIRMGHEAEVLDELATTLPS
jgi:hypothetical protein